MYIFSGFIFKNYKPPRGGIMNLTAQDKFFLLIFLIVSTLNFLFSRDSENRFKNISLHTNILIT